MDEGSWFTALNIQRDKESLGYSISQYRLRKSTWPVKNNVYEIPLRKKSSGLQINSQSNTGLMALVEILLQGSLRFNETIRLLVVVDGIQLQRFGWRGGGGGSTGR